MAPSHPLPLTHTAAAVSVLVPLPLPAGPLRFFRSYSWIMLPSDMLLLEDPAFRQIAFEYADRNTGEAVWQRDFAAAYKKVTELGLDERHGGGAARHPKRRGGGGGGGGCGPSPRRLRGSSTGCPFAAKLSGGGGGGEKLAGAVKPPGHP